MKARFPLSRFRAEAQSAPQPGDNVEREVFWNAPYHDARDWLGVLRAIRSLPEVEPKRVLR